MVAIGCSDNCSRYFSNAMANLFSGHIPDFFNPEMTLDGFTARNQGSAVIDAISDLLMSGLCLRRYDSDDSSRRFLKEPNTVRSATWSRCDVCAGKHRICMLD